MKELEKKGLQRKKKTYLRGHQKVEQEIEKD